jgi:hypothetical protein
VLFLRYSLSISPVPVTNYQVVSSGYAEQIRIWLQHFDSVCHQFVISGYTEQSMIWPQHFNSACHQLSCESYSSRWRDVPIMGVYLYVIIFVRDFRQFCGFLGYSSICTNKTNYHYDITEILLKVDKLIIQKKGPSW